MNNLEDIRQSYHRQEQILQTHNNKKMDDFLRCSSPITKVMRRNVSLTKKPSKHIEQKESFLRLHHTRAIKEFKFATEKLIKTSALN